jgi:hypothetical protein
LAGFFSSTQQERGGSQGVDLHRFFDGHWSKSLIPSNTQQVNSSPDRQVTPSLRRRIGVLQADTQAGLQEVSQLARIKGRFSHQALAS